MKVGMIVFHEEHICVIGYVIYVYDGLLVLFTEKPQLGSLIHLLYFGYGILQISLQRYKVAL